MRKNDGICRILPSVVTEVNLKTPENDAVTRVGSSGRYKYRIYSIYRSQSTIWMICEPGVGISNKALRKFQRANFNLSRRPQERS